MKLYLYTILVLVSFLAIPAESAAQKTRVRCGVTESGIQSYMEVYEYDYVSDKPSFPGGECKFMSFLNSTRVYPTEAYNNGIQGRVVCSFVVNTDGSVSNIEVLKGVCPSLNAEAMRILAKMPDWTPGKIDGKTVPVRVIRTVPFRK